jgi:hypothetical protein
MGASTPSLSGPRSRETLLEMGQRAQGRGDWQQAAEVFGQLLGTEPGVVQGWLVLG